MFTRPAPDTEILVHLRQKQSFAFDHVHGLGRTVLRTRPALRLLCDDDAIVFHEPGLPDLYQLLRLRLQREYGSRGADLAADDTVIVAGAERVVHPRLEDSARTVLEEGRAQDLRGAGVDAKVACSAARRETPGASGPRRRYRKFAP